MKDYLILTYFPLLNNLHNIKHVVRDYKRFGISDTEVYQLAVSEKRLIITFNKKHFQELAHRSKNTGIIALSQTLPAKQRDIKLTAFLRKKLPTELFGKLHTITGEDESGSQ